MNKEETEQKAYVIDIYNPNNTKKNEDAVQIFKLNQSYFAIFSTSLSWGKPVFKNQTVEDEDEYDDFYIYETLDEAKAFVRKLKELEGAKL